MLSMQLAGHLSLHSSPSKGVIITLKLGLGLYLLQPPDTYTSVLANILASIEQRMAL